MSRDSHKVLGGKVLLLLPALGDKPGGARGMAGAVLDGSNGSDTLVLGCVLVLMVAHGTLQHGCSAQS